MTLDILKNSSYQSWCGPIWNITVSCKMCQNELHPMVQPMFGKQFSLKGQWMTQGSPSDASPVSAVLSCGETTEEQPDSQLTARSPLSQ